MAYDIIRGKSGGTDWSCGATDLPRVAKGYGPETFWGPSDMEDKLREIMSKKAMWGLGPKPTRPEALKELAAYMKDHKIGPKDVTDGIGAEVGNIIWSKNFMNKVDDLRYDVRGIRTTVGGGLFALAGAFAFLGFAEVYRAARSTHGKG